MQSLLFGFQGRINRAKYWLVHLAVWVVLVVVLAAVFGGAAMTSDPSAAMGSVGAIGIIVVAVVYVVVFWISLAISVKRWHDRNKSGWWIFIALVPLVGPFWYLIECGFLPGTSGANTYGADPLAK